MGLALGALWAQLGGECHRLEASRCAVLSCSGAKALVRGFEALRARFEVPSGSVKPRGGEAMGRRRRPPGSLSGPWALVSSRSDLARIGCALSVRADAAAITTPVRCDSFADFEFSRRPLAVLAPSSIVCVGRRGVCLPMTT